MSENSKESSSDIQSKSIQFLLINDSFKRLFYGNFEKLDCDLLIVILFMFICFCSWQTTYYLLQYFHKRKWEIKSRNLNISSNNRPSNTPAFTNSARISRSMAPGRTTSDQNSLVIDYRATGDGWENERHMDPEYDDNSDMLLLLLNEAESIENEEQAEDAESISSSEQVHENSEDNEERIVTPSQNNSSIIEQRVNAETSNSRIAGVDRISSSTHEDLSNSNETAQQNLEDN